MPTTRTITVYQLEELDDTAKDRAYQHWLDWYPYLMAPENQDTLTAFCELFPVKIDHWEYDAYTYSIHCTVLSDYPHEAVPDLRGWRLATYIWNNYGDRLYTGKYYFTHRWGANGEYTAKSRRSKVIMEHSCVLTGYCRDEDILEPVYAFLQHPDGTTLSELMQQCCIAWVKACSDDCAASTSEAAFAEFCDDNGITFDATGRVVEDQ